LKDRLLTLALALGAVVLFYVFLAPKPANPLTDTQPLSTDSGDDGYQALWRWLRSQDIPVVASHDPYSRLTAAAAFPARGNVLLTTLPQRVPARLDELNALDAWVERGNTLLVMAALDDTPGWAVAASPAFLRTLGRMTRLKFEVPVKPKKEGRAGPAKEAPAAHPEAGTAARTLRAMQHALQPQHLRITATGTHPLFDGVRRVAAESEFPASRWHAEAMDTAPVLEIGQYSTAADGSGAEPAVWLKGQGAGQIIVFAVASAFSNRTIAVDDNAQLLSNILAWARASGGAVIFDDDHQGAVSYYDAKAFFHDARLHWTLFWILLLWLLYVLGWQRMRSAAPTWNPADVTNFIGVTGGFFAASLTPAAAGRRLFENFFGVLKGARGSSVSGSGPPPWEWISSHAHVQPAQMAELKRLHARAHAGKAVDLVRLHNLLTRLEGNLE
jgi:hypothetical protein